MEEKKLKTIKTIKVQTDEIKPMDISILAESVKKVADNMDKVLNSGLTLRAICILINDMMPTKEKVGIPDIRNVLIYASNLKKYIKK